MSENASQDKSSIGVLGAGSWGTALAATLAKNNVAVSLWGNEPKVLEELTSHHTNAHYLPNVKLPEAIHACDSLSELVAKHEKLLIAVPSHAFRLVVSELKPLLTNRHKLIWATKGLDPHTGGLLSEVVVELLGPGFPIAVLSGPSFAKEVAEDMPTAVSVACTDNVWLEEIISLFHSHYFRVYPTADLVGVQLAGTVKNVLAIAAGISDGLGFGANTRFALITRGLAEMARLGESLGATPQTFMGLAGIGDLMLTCSDDQSRNRRFGLALGNGMSIDEAKDSISQVIEGIGNAQEVHNLAAEHSVEMPIVEQVFMVIQGQTTPQEAVDTLLAREPHF